MTWTESESARLREERAELGRKRSELTAAIERVQHVGSAADGEEYVAAREEKALIQARIDEIDEILARE
ncbi:hypothetical protein ACFV24_33160 [Nocardia fluminea]|uniref:hypothetical protein n=1 Tax=Nocardia fluminea TaxID=134984 RepID=UPI0033F6F7BE